MEAGERYREAIPGLLPAELLAPVADSIGQPMHQTSIQCCWVVRCCGHLAAANGDRVAEASGPFMQQCQSLLHTLPAAVSTTHQPAAATKYGVVEVLQHGCSGGRTSGHTPSPASCIRHRPAAAAKDGVAAGPRHRRRGLHRPRPQRQPLGPYGRHSAGPRARVCAAVKGRPPWPGLRPIQGASICADLSSARSSAACPAPNVQSCYAIGEQSCMPAWVMPP